MIDAGGSACGWPGRQHAGRGSLVDCNSETGSARAGRKIVTVTDSLDLESFTISDPELETNITVTGH
jgi:hypothetical protein